MHLAFLAPAFLLLALRPFEDPITIKFSFAGTVVGENRYERSANGAFTSVTKVEIMGTKIASKLTGKYSGAKLASFTLDETVGPVHGKISYAAGKYEADGPTGKKSGKVAIDTTALFANYHPALTGTVSELLGKTTPTPKSLRILVLDNLVAQSFPVTWSEPRTVRAPGGAVSARTVSLEMGPVKVDYAVDGSNRVLGMDVPAQKFQGVAEGYADVFSDPMAKYPELSQPTHAVRRMSGVRVPMRDGILLAADVVLPAEDGKYPVILSRTPYGRKDQLIDAEWWAKRGYAVVGQDVRGRHDSEGKFDPFVSERKDGYDTLEWLSRQPWCDGNVGMIGGSYVGLVQWAAAVERHPVLKCIVPQVSPPDAFFNIPYDHGIFMLWGTVWWSNIVKDKVSNMGLATAALKNIDKVSSLPLSKVDNLVLGRNIDWFDSWLKKDRPSLFKGYDYGKEMPKVEIPALHISGWWDGDGIGTKRNWAAMAKAGRTNQWLIYGPWTHAFNTSSKIGDVDYGPTAIMELDSVYLRWFDTWLKGRQVGLEKLPKVQAFVTGANEWRRFSAWPDPASKPMTMYLGHDSGPTFGRRSNGKLTVNPSSKNPSSGYAYDPRQTQVPPELKRDLDLQGGSTRIDVKDNDDIAIYKSAPMANPLDIGGPIELDLYFSTSAKDTDFFAGLVDVDPKGVMRLIGQPGKMRAKYLSGWETPKLITPGKTYRMRIDIWDTAHRFKKGHRVGLIVTSEMFPMFARNLNTGESYFSGTKMVVAKQKIYHDKARPSALRFRVLPSKG